MQIREENPGESEATCHRFMKKKVQRGSVVPRPGATSTVPETPGRGGADVVIGDVSKKRKQGQSVESNPAKKAKSRKVSDEESKKRMQGQSVERNPANKVRVKARKVSDEAPKEIIERLSQVGKEIINASLPGMIAGLQKQDKPWKEYKNKHGGNFSEHNFLSLLVRSKGSSTMYNNESARKQMMEHNSSVTTEFL